MREITRVRHIGENVDGGVDGSSQDTQRTHNAIMTQR